MFERRLKIFLLVLLVFTVVLMVRAADVQVLHHDYWSSQAADQMRHVEETETTRGRILDINGNVLAVDAPCIDACVDYRAILDPPDPKWLAKTVADRLKNHYGPRYKTICTDQQRTAETQDLLNDIQSMWDALAQRYQPESAIDPADARAAIDDLRRQIIANVEAQKRLVWWNAFKLNTARAAQAPRWQRWLAGLSASGSDMSEFAVDVSDEQQPHVILRAISDDAAKSLGKHLEHFPGLSLQPSVHRTYPHNEVACHLLGRMTTVSARDLEQSHEWDETRRYHTNDQVGREGVEALCEPLLRGSRGQIEREVGSDTPVSQTDFVPGKDVRISIDADLQAQAQEMLKHVRFWSEKSKRYDTEAPADGISMHGAIVVIDIKTSEVRVLASNPDFNLNDLDNHYSELLADKINAPLRNRATRDAFEPGSTVKPMIGLAAITAGELGPLEGIECTGYLLLPILDQNGNPTDKKIREPNGRCWVASELGEQLREKGMSVAHHPVPIPHVGHDGNPDGTLSYRDALERSCNVFFETVADRLKPEGLAFWYDQFGFGRKTGIGIAEEPGLRPGQVHRFMLTDRMDNCFAGIGQGHVWATPLQIANEAATIARDGIWMRPRLLTSDTQDALDQATPKPTEARLDQVDLHLDPAGLIQAKMGMINVVNSDAGTGNCPRRTDMVVAGKTGSAQGAPLLVDVIDQTGRKVINDRGVRQRDPMVAVCALNPNTPTPWYRASDKDGKKVEHAWFMGFAPAEKPEIAFCVLIEYAGGGGETAAGPVVRDLLDVCVAHHYLHPTGLTPDMAAAQ